MKLVKKMLSDLRRPERNVRLHTDRQLKELRRSIEMFGQIRPIVVDENNVMLAGNGLCEALLSMGWKEADCHVVTGLSEKQKKKLMLADNKVYTLGSDDMAAFDAIIAELGGDSDIPGFDPQLIETLMASMSGVDEMLSSYGTFDDNSRDSMQTREARKISQESSFQPPAGESAKIPQREPVNPCPILNREEDAQESTESRYVVCPRCGERIEVGALDPYPAPQNAVMGDTGGDV
ncbi:MAG: ParB/Srx family N-terminal domain-containing protein [Clostridia bacterium]